MPVLEQIISKEEHSGLPELPSLSSVPFLVEYSSVVPIDEHERRREKVASWLLKENILSPHEIIGASNRILTLDEWNMIRENNPADYSPIAFAKGMSSEQQERFRRFVPTEKSEYAHYLKLQCIWEEVAVKIYEKNNQKLSCDDEAKIVYDFSGEFRAYRAMKIHALGESLEYPWGDNLLPSGIKR